MNLYINIIMKFNIIVAVDLNNGIGLNNNIPWLNEYSDLKYFKKITTDCDSKTRQNVIIMGKNTWNSLPKKPLPNRLNCIISNTINKKSDNILVFNSLDKCLSSLENNYFHKINEIFVIGGEQLYKEAIVHPKCNIIYKTT